jgi:hypothetical protein
MSTVKNMESHLLVAWARLPSMNSTDFTLRQAGPTDTTALVRLEQLDSSAPLAVPVLVAERDGRVVAAVSVADGAVAADPFVQTADVVAVLRLRAAQLQPAGRERWSFRDLRDAVARRGGRRLALHSG